MSKKRNPNAAGGRRDPRFLGWISMGAIGVLLLAGGLWLLKDTVGGPAPVAQAQPTSAVAPTASPVQPTATAGVAPPTATGAAAQATATEPPQATATPSAAKALASAEEVQRIDPAEAKALLDSGQAVMVDTRGAEFYQQKHVAGALSLPYDQVEAQAGTLPKDKIIILYCT